ncbi:YALI0F24673p [Pseudodesulfovibrio profundus]|uniref:YALI0F24673p n=1 Tax=Pseudodesulfovibrio profundus TaxID=57320 RepID=A0A2C8F977_9BACT|nr:hypothetical protein [Pseudodesulfovibrio profundus]SOB58979.1 YALI0F24673p [Pseudodesulfovibrio profundus]
MRDFWAFISGVAVGILAATGVYALEKDGKTIPIEYDEGEVDGMEEETEEDTDNDGRLIVRGT